MFVCYARDVSRPRLILTVHHEVEGEPARGRQSGMPHQTVQLLAVHAPKRVQGELRADHPIGGAIVGLAAQLRVPGEARRRAGH